MKENQGIKIAFTKIKDDMQYLYNHIEEAKNTQQAWLNNIINNQNNQSQRLQEIEARMQQMEQQINLIMQVMQNKSRNKQDWMLVEQRH